MSPTDAWLLKLDSDPLSTRVPCHHKIYDPVGNRLSSLGVSPYSNNSSNELTSTSTTTYTYDSFGKLTASTGSLVNPFRYTARESDTEVGLYYHRARYYDPVAGRFISEDPILFWGGLDFYTYVRNNPVTYLDPSGRDLKSWLKDQIPYVHLTNCLIWGGTAGKSYSKRNWKKSRTRLQQLQRMKK